MPIKELVYGPVQSRRLGLSLGINPLGSVKLCSFDCPFCHLGRSVVRMNQIRKEVVFPTVDEIEKALRDKIRELKKEKEQPFQTLTISGNGEPTLHPEFDTLVERTLSVRDEMLIKAPLVILTNGAHMDSKKIILGLNKLDERMLKIDVGSDRMMKVVNDPLIRGNIARIVTGTRKLKDVIVQSLFAKGIADNTKNEDIEDWIEVIGMIKPKIVHIYSVYQPTAIPGILKVDEDTLYTIASKLKRRTQIESLVFP